MKAWQAFGAALALGLAGCGPTIVPDVRSLLSRAAIDGYGAPLLFVEVPDQALAASLIVEEIRDGTETWRTADRQTISLQEGLLVATRGLGNDVMSADVSGTRAALAGGPRTQYARFASFLDGDDRTVFRSLLCNMAPPRPDTVESFSLAFPVSLHVETCATTGLVIENRYWTDPDGTMRRSQQWAGPALGMLYIERISRE
jgi:hypothetical protein